MNRVLLHPEELTPDGTVELTGRRADHIVQVLRARSGQALRVGVVDGPVGDGRIAAVEPGRVTLHCRFGHTPARGRLNLLLALPRPKVMKRLWSTLASLGVDRIVLVNAARVERCYFDSHCLREDVFRALLIEGLEQGGGTRLPRVAVERRLRPLIEDRLPVVFPDARRVVADPDAETRVAELPGDRDRPVLVAVGPEGGWTAFERRLLVRHGFVPVSLGPHILRSDVACVAMLALARECLLR